MRRRNKAAVIGIVAILAFVFLIPVVQVSFARPPQTPPCTNSAGQITSLCGSLQGQGYASVTYWLFGIGGFYGTLPNSGYSLAL